MQKTPAVQIETMEESKEEGYGGRFDAARNDKFRNFNVESV